MNLYKYTLQELKKAIETSVSIRQVLLKLGVKPAGGNYSTFHKAVKYFNIDTSHFTGKNLSKRNLPKRRLPINEYLINESNIQSNKLKKYLLDAEIFQPVCFSCGLREWLTNPIPLELDHINGVNNDNRLENLRLLCPNCHALTPTYRGRNIQKS